MSQESLMILGVGVALAAAILPGQWAMRRDLAELRERLARLEGAVEILTKFLIDRERGVSVAE